MNQKKTTPAPPQATTKADVTDLWLALVRIEKLHKQQIDDAARYRRQRQTFGTILLLGGISCGFVSLLVAPIYLGHCGIIAAIGFALLA